MFLYIIYLANLLDHKDYKQITVFCANQSVLLKKISKNCAVWIHCLERMLFYCIYQNCSSPRVIRDMEFYIWNSGRETYQIHCKTSHIHHGYQPMRRLNSEVCLGRMVEYRIQVEQSFQDLSCCVWYYWDLYINVN